MCQAHVGLEFLCHSFIIISRHLFAGIGCRLFTQAFDGLVPLFEKGFHLLFGFLKRLDALHQPDVALAFVFQLCLHFAGHGTFGSRTVFLKLRQVFLERLDKLLAVLLLQLLFLHRQQNGLAVLVFGESRDAQKGENHTHYFSKHTSYLFTIRQFTIYNLCI